MIAPFDHKKVYGVLPPFMLKVTVPSVAPAQLTAVPYIVSVIADGSPIGWVKIPVQLLPSVTVTV